jgi:hypothetical protein
VPPFFQPFPAVTAGISCEIAFLGCMNLFKDASPRMLSHFLSSFAASCAGTVVNYYASYSQYKSQYIAIWKTVKIACTIATAFGLVHLADPFLGNRRTLGGETRINQLLTSIGTVSQSAPVQVYLNGILVRLRKCKCVHRSCDSVSNCNGSRISTKL